ncbi:MAG: rhodanese-like domain-containing protein [Sphingomonadaceae bacterium]
MMKPQPLDLGKAPKIDLEEAKAEFDRGTALFVDVRNPEAFNRSHVPRAVCMPLMQIPLRAEELPHDRTIILY